MDERELTLIIVPEGDPETRTIRVPYRRVRIAIVAAGVFVVLFIVMAASWWYVAAQAARVPGLERQLGELEAERAKVARLARTLTEVEAQYERVRQMLGADGAAAGGAAASLPPLRDTAVSRGAGGGELGAAPRGAGGRAGGGRSGGRGTAGRRSTR